MKRPLHHHSFLGGISLVVMMASVLGALFLSNRLVFADTPDWLASKATAEVIVDPLAGTPKINNHTQQCAWQSVSIGSSLTPLDACVYQAKSFRLAYTSQCIPLWYGGCTTDRFMAISIGSDSRFYRITNMEATNGDTYWQVSPSSDRLVSTYGRNLGVIDDIIGHLSSQLTLTGREYTLEPSAQTFLKNSDGNFVTVGAAAMSANGEWLAGEAVNMGLFRMHLTDGEVRVFTRDTAAYNRGSDPSYEFSITDDGKYVATGGWNVGGALYHLDDKCGKSTTVFWKDWTELGDAQSFPNCPSQNLTDILVSASGYEHSDASIRSIDHMRFDEIGDTLELSEVLNKPIDGQAERWVRLYAPGYTKPQQLDYLAMGDSYSSGEGDAEKRADGASYYLPGTEQRGECHISSRSYPFLLRGYYNIPQDRMESVTCSGAQVVLDYLPRMDSYMGQHKELQGMSEDRQKTERKNALENFTPGIVPQIEFVKRYQPKVITLTGGGNDIGFANIIAYCAGFTWEDLTPIDSDCGYAKPGSELNTMLYDSIDTQYTYNKRLIDEIKEVSPETRIIIVGYPSFINSDMPACSLTLNSGVLSQNERRAINAGLSYMNSMLQKLAHDTSVSYVDIENSLNGGRMCEGSEYITGVSAAGYRRVVFQGDNQETFHPNASGHRMIADAIEHSGAFVSDNIPGTNQYRPSESATISLPDKLIDGSWLAAGSALKVATGPSRFIPLSPVCLIGFSDEVDLGTYTADSEGGLVATIAAPNLPIGEHVLMLKGQTYSGEAVRYYQFIDVVAPETASRDSEQKATQERSVVDESNANALGGLSTNKQSTLATGFGGENIGAINRSIPGTPAGEVKDSKKGFNAGLLWTSLTVLAVLLLTGGTVYVVKYRKTRNY